MPTRGTSSGSATKGSSAASNFHWRLLAGILCIAAAAPAAAQQSVSYSSYLDDATVIAAAPDGSIVGASQVGAVFGSPFTPSGYELDVNGLAPGTYVVAVFAHSTVANSFAAVQTRQVTIQ